MYDGSVKIECLADTSKFDKQMVELEGKVEEAEKENKIKMSVSDKAKRDLEDYKEKIVEVEQEYEKLSAKKEQMDSILEKKSAGISLTSAEFTAIENYEQIANKVEKAGNNLDKMYAKESMLKQKVESTNFAYEKSTNKVNKLKDKLNQLKLDKSKTGIKEFQEGLEKAGKSIKSSIRSVGKMALAIFGIRTALSLLSRASSTIAQYDEEYASNLEYIRYALAMSLKPVLEYIVGLLAQALQYVNYIASAWFGITGGIFKSASAFKSAKNSMASMSKSAKEMDKYISGFDEIEKVNDSLSAGVSGGAGAGQIAPSIDISQMQGEVPSWLKWIADNKDKVLAVLGGIAGFLVSIRLGLGLIDSLGIGVMIAGIVYSIGALLKYLKSPTWENFGKVIAGIGVIIAGLGILILGFPAVVTGVVIAIVGLIVANWEKIKKVLQGAIDWIRSKLSWIKDNFGIFGEYITKQFLEIFQFIVNSLDLVFTTWKKVFDQIIEFFKNVFTGNWKGAWENIKNIVFIMLDALKQHFINMWNFIINIFSNIGNTIKNVFNTAWNLIREGFAYNWNLILSMMSKGGQIFNGIKDGISSIFRDIVNNLISGINWVIAQPFNRINSMLNTIKNFSVMGAKPFENAWGWNPIPVPKIQYLKTGGIINYPNRGVGIGGMAIGGESGREGVIPLTDSQAMETLGQAIGKYITVNATINNSMNGRLISRILKQIQTEQDFAYNT